MVDKVIAIGVRAGRGGEVDAILFADGLRGVVISVQTDERWMKVFEVPSNAMWQVASRVDSDENGEEDVSMFLLCFIMSSCKNKRVNDYLRTVLTTVVILSSSAGQMSGQLANPKYTNDHLPSKSFSVNGFPSCVVNENGPPTLGRPYCRLARSFSV